MDNKEINQLDDQVKNLRSMMEDLEKTVSEMKHKEELSELKEVYDKKFLEISKEVERIEAEIKIQSMEHSIDEKESLDEVKTVAEPIVETKVEPSDKDKAEPKIETKVEQSKPAYAYADKNNLKSSKEKVNKPDVKPKNIPPKKNSFEDNLGKVGLPLIAAVLIFLSFVYFASYIAPLLTDAQKVAIMTVVSMVFIVLGIIGANFVGKMLANAVAGIGVGSLFITIIATHMYFEMISSSVLLLLLMIWVTSVAVISWFRDKLFYYIGEVGMVIAVILGVVQITGKASTVSDTKDIIILFLFTMYGTIAIALTNIKEKFEENIPTYVQFSLSMLMFVPVLYTMVNNYINGYYALLVLMAIAFILYELYKSLLHTDKNTGYAVSFAYDAIILSLAINSVVDGTEKYIAIIAAIFMILIPARMGLENNKGLSVKMNVVALAVSTLVFAIEGIKKILFTNTKNIFDIFGNVNGVEDKYYLCAIAVTILLLIAIAFAFFSKNKVYAIMALVINLVYSVVATYNSLIIILVELLIIAVLSYKTYKEYDSALKVGIYMSFYIPVILVGKMCMSLTNIQDYSSRRVLAWLFMGLLIFAINAVVEFTKLKYDLSIKDKIKLDNNFFVITTIFTTLSFLIVLAVAEDEKYLPLVFLALLLGAVKTPAMIKKSDNNMVLVIIEMAKYWLWSWCVYDYYEYMNNQTSIYHNYSHSGFLLSIMWLIISAIFFACGLMFNRKNVRKAGMIACILSVAKLIFIDIELDNSLVKMSVYFFGGLIFLGLAKIYSELSQRDKKKEDKDSKEE